jgi:hypothetical protein
MFKAPTAQKWDHATPTHLHVIIKGLVILQKNNSAVAEHSTENKPIKSWDKISILHNIAH